MIRSKLLYAVLLVVLVLFYYLYRGDPERGDLSLALLVFAVLFPLILLLGLLRLKHSMWVRLFHSKEPIRKGQLYQWVLQITNPSIFSSAESQITLEYENSLTGERQEMTFVVPILPRNSQRVRFSFHAVTCGQMRIRIKEIVLYDPLRIFRQKLPMSLQDQVLILPDNKVQVPEEWPPVPHPDSDSPEFSKVKSGDDPSEIFDLHTYREGDAISRIHWKLSSKLDHLMVKEYSLPLSSGSLLVLDPSLTGEMPEAALRLDTAYSVMFAAAASLAEQELSFAMTHYDPDRGMIDSELYESLPEASAWMRMAVASAPVSGTERTVMLTSMAQHLSDSRIYERIIVITPRLDDAMTDLLSTLPHSEQLVVFAVVGQHEGDPSADPTLPFRCIPVAQQEPVHPAAVLPRPGEEPDYDSEELVEGGAAS